RAIPCQCGSCSNDKAPPLLNSDKELFFGLKRQTSTLANSSSARRRSRRLLSSGLLYLNPGALVSIALRSLFLHGLGQARDAALGLVRGISGSASALWVALPEINTETIEGFVGFLAELLGHLRKGHIPSQFA